MSKFSEDSKIMLFFYSTRAPLFELRSKSVLKHQNHFEIRIVKFFCLKMGNDLKFAVNMLKLILVILKIIIPKINLSNLTTIIINLLHNQN